LSQLQTLELENRPWLVNDSDFVDKPTTGNGSMTTQTGSTFISKIYVVDISTASRRLLTTASLKCLEFKLSIKIETANRGFTTNHKQLEESGKVIAICNSD